MIIFQNDAPLDIRAIKTFGVNSKDNPESAIGYFGTGLKYAIAILLRHKHSITIYTNGTMYRFDVVKTRIRNDDFDIITMNGEELGFTTDLGKDWELWMAFRELYSNMLDEKGSAARHTNIIGTTDDSRTYVCVTGDGMEKLFDARDEYFLNKDKLTPVATHTEVDAYPKQETGAHAKIFYKGVRVMESREASLYDYNHHLGLKLSEDRTVKDSWSTLWHVATLVVESKDVFFIQEMVMAPEHSYEVRIQFRSTGSNIDVFLDTVGELRKRYKDLGVNPTAICMHAKLRKISNVMPTESCPLNKIQTVQWDKATTFCKDVLGLDLDKYQAIVCEDIGKRGVYGLSDIRKGIMYISKDAFRKGTKCVATALLEEFTHCHHEVADETLQQKWVYLDQILSLGEQLQGEPL